MKQIQGGVTAAKGFEAAGVEAAIKYQNRKDMALIVSKAPCTVAGTFTSNVVKAAPVLWDKQIVEHSAFAQAVVVNSGIANACTGKQGLDCCEAEAKCAGELLGENFQGDAAEVRQRRCSGFLQHDLRGWRYFHQ